MTTPNLDFAEMPSNLKQPSTPFNANFQIVDALLNLKVVDKDLSAPPTTLIGDLGKCWIVGAAATGAWTGEENNVALCVGADLWAFIGVNEGFKAWVIDEALDYKFASGAWSIYTVTAAAPAFVDVTGDPLDNIALDALFTAIDAAIEALRTKTQALSNVAGVVDIDCDAGDFCTITLAANVTSLTFSNLPAAGYAKAITIRIIQNGTGGFTFALPASFKAIDGSDTAIGSAANAVTILTIQSFDQGTRWEYAMQGAAA